MEVGKFLGFLPGDSPLVFKVNLVANKNLHNVRVSMLVYTLEPGLYIGEGLLLSDVKCYYHPIRLLIKGIGYCFKTFLPRRVPNLHCYILLLWRFIGC
jgi:hypothetical protein